MGDRIVRYWGGGEGACQSQGSAVLGLGCDSPQPGGGISRPSHRGRSSGQSWGWPVCQAGSVTQVWLSAA